jgi:hypothetical protein
MMKRLEGSSHGETRCQAAGQASRQRLRPPREGAIREAKKESGNHPIPDEDHAISAKRLSAKQRKEGNLTWDCPSSASRHAARAASIASRFAISDPSVGPRAGGGRMAPIVQMGIWLP